METIAQCHEHQCKSSYIHHLHRSILICSNVHNKDYCNLLVVLFMWNCIDFYVPLILWAIKRWWCILYRIAYTFCRIGLKKWWIEGISLWFSSSISTGKVTWRCVRIDRSWGCMRPLVWRSAQVRNTSAGAGGQLSSLWTCFVACRPC